MIRSTKKITNLGGGAQKQEAGKLGVVPGGGRGKTKGSRRDTIKKV